MSFGHVPLWLYLPDYKMDLIIENICKQYFKYPSNQFSGPKILPRNLTIWCAGIPIIGNGAKRCGGIPVSGLQ